MNDLPTPPPTASLRVDLLQRRVGRQLASRLEAGATAAPHAVHERLRAAREQALARAVECRRAAAADEPAFAHGGHRAPARMLAFAGAGAASMGGAAAPPGPSRPRTGWRWLAGAVPLVLLVSGLFVIQDSAVRARDRATIDVDAALLADDLPPGAYNDPAFVEFLRSERQ